MNCSSLFQRCCQGVGDSIEQKEEHIQETAGQGGEIQTNRNGLSCKIKLIISLN